MITYMYVHVAVVGISVHSIDQLLTPPLANLNNNNCSFVFKLDIILAELDFLVRTVALCLM